MLFKCRYMPYTMDIPKGIMQHEVGFGFELGTSMGEHIFVASKFSCGVWSCNVLPPVT